MTKSIIKSLTRAIEFAGSKSALARALGVTPGAVSNWTARGSIPAEQAVAIEALTLGAVTAAQLNPSLFARS
jgi:DNA-binding transcriptional regulator YdaS (Cro superfamily)